MATILLTSFHQCSCHEFFIDKMETSRCVLEYVNYSLSYIASIVDPVIQWSTKQNLHLYNNTYFTHSHLRAAFHFSINVYTCLFYYTYAKGTRCPNVLRHCKRLLPSLQRVCLRLQLTTSLPGPHTVPWRKGYVYLINCMWNDVLGVFYWAEKIMR